MSDTTIEAAAVDAAIARAHKYVRGQQDGDGSWAGGTIAGPDATAEAVIGLAFAGALSAEDGRRAARSMLRQQLEDGSFAPYQDGPGTLDQTCIVYAALLRAGEDPQADACARAWRWIEARGGFAAAEMYTQVLLVAGGVLEAAALTAMPVAWVLIPGVERVLGSRFTPAFTQIFMMLPALIRGLQRQRRPAAAGSLAACEDARVCDYIARHQNPTGNLFGAINTTVLAILTYAALGVTDDRLGRAIADLKQWRRDQGDELEYITFDSRVWNTALLVTALRQGGVAAEDPAIDRAVEYMVTRQSFWPLPRDWQNPTPFTPRTGGWPFEDRNPLGADCDSTSEVLQALAHLQPLPSRIQGSVDAGLRWLYGMQSADGGWPAFSRGHRGKSAGPLPITALDPPTGLMAMMKMMIEPPVQLGDPSTEDLTGRVLQALGVLGGRARDRRIAPAIRFLKNQVDGNGAWWGRWECNYLASSAEVVSGLAAVGADLTQRPFADAIAWMLARQNADGGWGETEDSYANLGLAGTGASSQYVTGIVVTALIAAGHGRSPAIARAIARLLEIQQRDGSWEGGPYQFVVQWPWPFYRLEMTPTIYPLRALTAYRNAQRG